MFFERWKRVYDEYLQKIDAQTICISLFPLHLNLVSQFPYFVQRQHWSDFKKEANSSTRIAGSKEILKCCYKISYTSNYENLVNAAHKGKPGPIPT